MFYNKWCYFFDTWVLFAPRVYIGIRTYRYRPPRHRAAAADLIKTGFPGNNNIIIIIIIIIIVIIIYIEMAYGVFNPPARTL